MNQSDSPIMWTTETKYYHTSKNPFIFLEAMLLGTSSCVELSYSSIRKWNLWVDGNEVGQIPVERRTGEGLDDDGSQSFLILNPDTIKYIAQNHLRLITSYSGHLKVPFIMMGEDNCNIEKYECVIELMIENWSQLLDLKVNCQCMYNRDIEEINPTHPHDEQFVEYIHWIYDTIDELTFQPGDYLPINLTEMSQTEVGVIVLGNHLGGQKYEAVIISCNMQLPIERDSRLFRSMEWTVGEKTKSESQLLAIVLEGRNMCE